MIYYLLIFRLSKTIPKKIEHINSILMIDVILKEHLDTLNKLILFFKSNFLKKFLNVIKKKEKHIEIRLFVGFGDRRNFNLIKYLNKQFKRICIPDIFVIARWKIIVCDANNVYYLFNMHS